MWWCYYATISNEIHHWLCVYVSTEIHGLCLHCAIVFFFLLQNEISINNSEYLAQLKGRNISYFLIFLSCNMGMSENCVKSNFMACECVLYRRNLQCQRLCQNMQLKWQWIESTFSKNTDENKIENGIVLLFHVFFAVILLSSSNSLFTFLSTFQLWNILYLFTFQTHFQCIHYEHLKSIEYCKVQSKPFSICSLVWRSLLFYCTSIVELNIDFLLMWLLMIFFNTHGSEKKKLHWIIMQDAIYI